MAYEPTTSVGRRPPRVLFRPQWVLGAGAAWGTTACILYDANFYSLYSTVFTFRAQMDRVSAC